VPENGSMTWAEVAAGPLAGATCLWQDLDGLHVEQAPDAPPYASILWGWRDDGTLIRARLDGDVAFVAVHNPGRPMTATVPWDARSGGDGRIAAARGPSADMGGVGATYEQVIVGGDVEGTGPVTFIRPTGRGRGVRGGGGA
jgi:hypothetical protein